MNSVKCKICFTQNPSLSCYTMEEKIPETDLSVMEMLLFCVPKMKSCIFPDDCICSICLEDLNVCNKFIHKCIENHDLLQVEGPKNDTIELANNIKTKQETPQLPTSLCLDTMKTETQDNIKTKQEKPQLPTSLCLDTMKTETQECIDIEMNHIEYSDVKAEEVMSSEDKLMPNEDSLQDDERKFVRFGTLSLDAINKKVITMKTTSRNTIRTKGFIWRQFTAFCQHRNYVLDGSASIKEIAKILTDWAFNMKRQNGEEYKQNTVKTIWNVTAKTVMEKFYFKYKIAFNPFLDIEFRAAREAKNAKRKKLQENITRKWVGNGDFLQLDDDIEQLSYLGIASCFKQMAKNI